MITVISMIVGLLLNTIGIWSIRLLRSDKNVPIRQRYPKYLYGIPAALALIPLLFPVSPSDVVLLAALGGALGEAFFIFFLAVKQTAQKDAVDFCYDDGSPPKFFITGDKHRHFDTVKVFCRVMETRRQDVLIVLGDAGFNYYGDKRDDELKAEISRLNITLFCLHGNKENRPQNISTYGIRSFCGGKVYYEPAYPNLYFAIDGEIYTFESKRYLVVGGAHSVDKLRCLEEGTPYWYDEMPDAKIRERVERNLQKEGNRVYGMMTHTCPIDYLPTEMFLSTKQNADTKKAPRKAKPKKTFHPDIDRSTEQWLGKLEKKLDYKVWFCGHYHIDKQIDKIRMLWKEIRPLHPHKTQGA